MPSISSEALRRIIANLRNKLIRQTEAVESTESQIEIFGQQLELMENPKGKK